MTKNGSNFFQNHSILVWFDAPFHGKSEYSLGFNFWPCFHGEKLKENINQNCEKSRFDVLLLKVF